MADRFLAVLGLFLTIAVGAPLAAEEAPAPASQTEGAVAPAENAFVRVRRDENGVAEALETAAVRYHGADGSYVDLVGAVHVADRDYYEQLNRQFRDFDAVLYELVAPEGTRIPQGGPEEENRHPVSQLQGGMKSLLELEHQLEVIDYTRPNLVHADMSPEEFAQSMKDRGESFLQILMMMTMEGMAEQSRATEEAEAGGLVDLALSLVSPKKASRVKEGFARQWENVLSGRGLEINAENAAQLSDLEMLLAMFSSNRAVRLKR
ncbi:MAG: hypothetical protein KY475_14100, partial [Planctomycetes bacterium]|nr:hypothetical protein [Planctomycetota bacterium]